MDHDLEPTHEANLELRSTQEILREKRKKAYAAAKAKRQAERREEKAAKRAAKLDARSARDQELWSAIKSGDEVTPSSPGRRP